MAGHACLVTVLLRRPRSCPRNARSATGLCPARVGGPLGRSRGSGNSCRRRRAFAGRGRVQRRRPRRGRRQLVGRASAHSVGPGRSLLAWRTRSAMAIWWRARSVCGLRPAQGGLRPSLRSRAASRSRAWWHHTARPAGDWPAPARSRRPGVRAGRRRGRRPGRGGCGPGRRRCGPRSVSSSLAAGGVSAMCC